MAYIQQFYTWSTGNTITAARLNGNVTNIVNSLNGSGGDRQVNVGSLEIGGVTVIDSSMNIDTGASNLTVGGKVNIDIDGTTLNANGSLNFGADQDAGILFNGTDLVIATDGAGASGIILDSEDDTLEIKGSGDLQATFDASGLNIVSGDAFSIDGTSVLNATTLGTGVLTSSLTTVGILDSGSITSGFGSIDVGSSSIDGGTITASTALGGTLSTASQPNITGVGTLGSLTISGNLTVDTNTLFVDGITQRVGIGMSPSEKLHVDGNIKAEDDMIFEGFLNMGTTLLVTIASGSVLATKSNIGVTSEGGTGTNDDLTTITGGTDGDILMIRNSTLGTSTVTVKTGIGNVHLNSDFPLSSSLRYLTLTYRNSNWYELSRSH